MCKQALSRSRRGYRADAGLQVPCCSRNDASFQPMFMRLLLTLPFLLLFLAGCDQASLVAKFASDDEQALAKSYIDRLRARDFEAIEKSLDKSLAGPNVRGNLQKMAASIPADEPRSVKLVGAHKHFQNGIRSLNTTFEYQFSEGWLLANVAIEERNGEKAITGLNVYPRTQSLEQENRFNIFGKQSTQYLILAGAIGAALVSLYALIACIRTKPLRRKWLWILFIVLGVGRFAVNWTSGEWSIVPISVQLLGAGATAAPYGPWIVSCSIPLGAIVFLFWRRRRARALVES